MRLFIIYRAGRYSQQCTVQYLEQGDIHSNDARSPDPAFTAAQYDRLALLYVIASARAERWLIPAFHAAIDAQIPNGHDDPLNFDVDSFAKSLEGVIAKLGTFVRVEASH